MTTRRIDPVRAASAVLALLLICVISREAPAKPVKSSAIGTLTVKGKTTVLKHVVATREADPDDPEHFWLVLLASDVPVAESDRSPGRLQELAAEGSLRAVRILWREGYDRVEAVPYHPDLKSNGMRPPERPTLDLRRLDHKRVEAEFSSKMMGQVWHFHANVKAPISMGGTLELEQEAETPEEPEADGAEGADAEVGRKRALGKLGYEYTPAMFHSAVADGNLDAVKLFLELGMSPKAKPRKKEDDILLYAASACSFPPEENRGPIVLALLAAGADVEAKDENGSTALLWAVQSSCPVDVVKALIAAGANVNAKARGGATPLMLAEVLHKEEVAAVLRKAGARPR